MKDVLERAFAGVLLVAMLVGAGYLYATMPESLAGAPAALNPTHSPTPLPAFHEFAASVSDGQAGVVQGIYAAGLFAYPVVQQPPDQPLFVSEDPGLVTQIAGYSAYGVIGLGAHAGLAGRSFYDLAIGQEVWVVYGDGQVASYTITRIEAYQVLLKEQGTAVYVDLETGVPYTWEEIFRMYYAGGNEQLVLQTCLARPNSPSWGRTFFTGQPVDVQP
jgi:hypothetical protein